MFFKRKAREVPELNTVSTADISFMLLIFFLVTTSINTEKGIKRTLPRITKTQKEALTEVNQPSLLSLTLNQQNQVVVKNAVIPIDSVHILAQQVIVNAKEQHVIKLETNAKATYNVYFKLKTAWLFKPIIVFTTSVPTPNKSKLTSKHHGGCKKQPHKPLTQKSNQYVS